MKKILIVPVIAACIGFIQFGNAQGSGSSTTILLQPDGIEGIDAHLSSRNNTTNYATLAYFGGRAWTYSGVPNQARGLIDFDLSSLPNDVTISDAKLTLVPYINGATNPMTGENAITISRVTQPWDEQTVTWDTQPSTDNTFQVNISSSSSASAYQNIDVTALLNDRKNNPTQNFGMMIQLVTEVQYRAAAFASSDHADITYRPSLEITYSTTISNEPDSTYWDHLVTMSGIVNNEKEIKEFERSNKIWGERLYPHGDFNVAATATQQYAMNFNATNQFISPEYDYVDWKNIGGSNNNMFYGQIHCIEFDPNYNGTNNQIVYAGTPFGGLFKSIDNGLNWSNLNTDHQLPISSVSDIAIKQDNPQFILISTGNGDQGVQVLNNPSGSVNPIFSTGIYRSTDGGKIWEAINDGLIGAGDIRYTIRRIIIDPNNTNVAFAATTNGIFKCDDINASSPNWMLIFDGDVGNGPDNTFKGLELSHHSNSQILIASGKEVYVSHNYGVNWVAYTGDFGSPTGADWNNDPQLYPNGAPVKINIAVTPANPNVIYAYTLTPIDNGTEIHILITDDLMNPQKDWRVVVNENDLTNPGGINYIAGRMALVADPFDVKIVYYGHTGVKRVDYDPFAGAAPYGMQTSISTNTSSSGHHMDVHALEYPINTPGKLWCGNDGGVSRKSLSTTGTAGWTALNTGLIVSKIWSFDDSEQNPNTYLIGLQDAGTNYSTDHGLNWTSAFGGDGYVAQIDDRDANNWFYKRQQMGHQLYRRTGPSHVQSSEASYTPYDPQRADDVFVPNHLKVINHPTTGELYFGFSELHRRIKDNPVTGDAPTDVYEIDSDMGKPNASGDEIAAWRRQVKEFVISSSNTNLGYIINSGGTGTLSWGASFSDLVNDGLAYAPSFFKTIIGGNNGDYANTDAYVNYTKYLPNQGTNYDYTQGNPTAPFKWHLGDGDFVTSISDIALNTADDVIMTFSGYDQDYKIWRSPDGEKWYNLDPNYSLPNLPVNSVVYDKLSNNIIIGTDVGVYIYNEDNQEWEKYGAFPNVRIIDLKINYSKKRILAGTFGRGLWEGELPCPTKNDGSTYTLTSDQTVTGFPFPVKGDIVVPSGLRLTYNGSLQKFAPGSKIIVQPGAELIILNSTLTTACSVNKQQWEGIQVLGDPTQLMPLGVDYTKGSFSTAQGYLFMEGSIISHAHEAFQNHRQHNWGADMNTIGGIIVAIESDFKNNWRSAEFLKYITDDYQSIFIDCKFTTTNSYGALRTDSDGNDYANSTFVSMWGVDGVVYRGCEFYNSRNDLIPENKGNGITAIDASYWVVPIRAGSNGNQPAGTPAQIIKKSLFKDLTFGIENYQSTGLGSRIIIEGSFFNQCLKGIYDVGSEYSKFNENEFSIPESSKLLFGSLPYTDEEPGYNWGLFTLGSTAFEINDNVFTSQKTQSSRTATFGSVVRESGVLGGEVLRNTYDDISMPSQMEDYNLALKLSCNMYRNYDQAWTVATHPSDVYPPPPPTQHLADQGTGCTLQTERANNTFEDNCSGTESQIKSITPFIYFDKVNIPNNQMDPLCISPIVTYNQCQITQPIKCDAPSGNSGGNGSGNAKSMLLSDIDNTDSPIEKQLLENKLIKTFLDLNDSKGAIDYLLGKNDLSSKKILAIIYFKENDYDKCKDALNSILELDLESTSFKKYYFILLNILSQNRAFDSMSQLELLEIESIVDTKTAVSYSAENLLKLVRKNEVNHNPYVSSEAESQSDEVFPNDDLSKIKIFPNPSSTGSFNIELFGFLEQKDIQVVDMFGAIIFETVIVTNASAIDLSNLSKGVYFVKVNDGIQQKVQRIIFN